MEKWIQQAGSERSFPAKPKDFEIYQRQPGRICMIRSDFNRISRIFGALIGGLVLVMMGMASLGTTLHAQASLFPQQDQEIPKVLATFEARFEPATARPGEHVRLIVTGRITDGWYTYSLVPQDDEFAPPPTTLKVKTAGLEIQGPVYETNPVLKKDKVFGIPLAFHPKSVRFYQNLRVPEKAGPGEITLTGALRYQVCNNRICTPPRTDKISAALSVEPGEVRPAFDFIQRTIDFKDADGNFLISADTLESALAGGLVGFLLLAVGFGFLALLTPCVFPMIPVTVSFFTSASDRGSRGVLKLALLFVAGIILTSTIAGLALTFALGATGVSQFATSPWVNLAVAAFFVVFAFSLMGFWDFSTPGGLLQRLNRASFDIKGPLGVLLMGVAFTATSFTCTMPFVGTLPVAATQGAVFWPVVGMLVYSSVFAFPFFLLALFPGFVVRLRGRSGNWLVQIKVVLGILELAAALKFISNADLIWQWGFFDRGLVLALWGVMAAAIALIVLGLMPWPGVSVTHRGMVRLASGAVFVALAMYMVAGVSGRELDSYTESYMPPSLERNQTASLTLGGGKYVDLKSVHALPWHPTLAPALARAKASGRPVFIDFTGYTCVNCRWMEKKIFSEKIVFEALRDRFELAQLYTDGGDYAEVNQKLQVERFRTLALPYYVILGPDNTVRLKPSSALRMVAPRKLVVRMIAPSRRTKLRSPWEKLFPLISAPRRSAPRRSAPLKSVRRMVPRRSALVSCAKLRSSPERL